MSRHRGAVAVACGMALVVVLGGAGSAAAVGGWSWPAGTGVVLGFGSQWVDAAGHSCSHGGVDISAAAGADVVAPVGARVRFAGEVPAAGGGRCGAVSLLTDDGLTVTCMPLSAIAVRTGQDVGEGSRIGALAATGDGSSPGAHVHLSVKRGESALDPESFLSAPAASPAPTAPDPAPVPAPAPTAPPAPVVAQPGTSPCARAGAGSSAVAGGSAAGSPVTAVRAATGSSWVPDVARASEFRRVAGSWRTRGRVVRPMSCAPARETALSAPRDLAGVAGRCALALVLAAGAVVLLSPVLGEGRQAPGGAAVRA